MDLDGSFLLEYAMDLDASLLLEYAMDLDASLLLLRHKRLSST